VTGSTRAHLLSPITTTTGSCWKQVSFSTTQHPSQRRPGNASSTVMTSKTCAVMVDHPPRAHRTASLLMTDPWGKTRTGHEMQGCAHFADGRIVGGTHVLAAEEESLSSFRKASLRRHTAKRRQVPRLRASPVGVCCAARFRNRSRSRLAYGERTLSVSGCQYPQQQLARPMRLPPLFPAAG
jgi:hypothetical protein